MAELTLVLVLATDASRIDLRALARDHSLPQRLLGIGLPLTMVLGTLVAALMFGVLSFWEAAILAVVLTPTDAGLGQAVVTSPKFMAGWPGFVLNAAHHQASLHRLAELDAEILAVGHGEPIMSDGSRQLRSLLE